MTKWTPQRLAVELLSIIDKDEARLAKIDRYARGDHDDPYMPDGADAEYKLIARRAKMNLMQVAEATPAQMLYVDDFSHGLDEDLGDEYVKSSPEWDHFQRSRMDARQTALYRSAFRHGFALTETHQPAPGAPSVTRGISALRSAGLYEDPANDLRPFAALEVRREPKGHKDDENSQPGKAWLWTEKHKHEVSFWSKNDPKSVTVGEGKPHGASSCPVVRFAPFVDLDGVCMGLVEPLIPTQDRINQTIFDLLIAQTYGSFKVRTITGMAPPIKMKPELDHEGKPTGEMVPELDSKGNFIPLEVNLNARRFMYSEDPDVKFGTLDETPLEGYVSSVEQAIRHWIAQTGTPPHFMLGQIANLSAEALQAAEGALLRMVESFQHSFGESWEEVFRIAAELDGIERSAVDFRGEVIWRDTGSSSLARSADALVKLRDINVPDRGLWRRVPGVTGQELRRWERWAQEDPTYLLSEQLGRSIPTRSSATRGPRPDWNEGMEL